MTRTLDDLKPSYDAVVVGARVAGASTALLLARGGLDVLLVERGVRGSDTLSTLALMRAGALQLSRWGLLDAVRAAGTAPIQTTTFHYDGVPLEIKIKPRDGVDALYAPRRTVLDPLLSDAAAAAGADAVWQTRVTELLQGRHGRVAGVVLQDRHGKKRQVFAPMVVGADGVMSTIAKLTDARVYRTGPHASGGIFTLVPDLAVSGYHWHFVKDAAAGVIPTNDGDVLVFASLARERFLRECRFDLAGSFHRILNDVAPVLAAQVRTSGTKGPFRGFAGQTGFFRQAWGPGWALVGDAGYFKDPLTAHGITDALRDAELLARAVQAGTDTALDEYQAIRDTLSLPLFEITDEIASYAWSIPRLQSLHTLMSDEMTRETMYLRDLTSPALHR